MSSIIAVDIAIEIALVGLVPARPEFRETWEHSLYWMFLNVREQ
jgi:hypothetical protein